MSTQLRGQVFRSSRRPERAAGDQAHAFGLTVRDLSGLLTVPEHAKPSFDRLSCYDEAGLICLLEGRNVLALTAETAAIQNPSSSITSYRRHQKPALGPLGDSLDNVQ